MLEQYINENGIANGFVYTNAPENRETKIPIACEPEMKEKFDAAIHALNDEWREISAKLADVFASDEYAGSSLENRAGMESRDEIRDLKMKLWEIRRRLRIMYGAMEFIPENESGAIDYFAKIRGDAIKELAIGIPTEPTPESIRDFLAAGIAAFEADQMLHALAGASVYLKILV